MACITKQRVGKYVYVYESHSFRNEEGKPRNKKVKIGKVDPKTGQVVFTKEYLDRMSQEGKPVSIPLDSPLPTDYTVGEFLNMILETVKSYGGYFFLTKMAEKIGLLPILVKTFPNCWQQILNLACFMVATGDPVLYCEDWLSQVTEEGVKQLTSQRVSELFSQIVESERNDFYERWMTFITENEYIALDITSISSYSEMMQLSEWGYNRDHDDLPQINMCMLFGETTQLPVYQTVYRGSLRDVSTLQTTLKEVTLLCPEINPKIVMDKGFFSAENVNSMLETVKRKRGSSKESSAYSFLLAVPFTSKFARDLVLSAKNINTVQNTILTSEGAIRGICKKCRWPNIEKPLNTFIFYNPIKAEKEKNEYFQYVTELKRLAETDPCNKRYQSEFEKYLVITQVPYHRDQFDVKVREDVLADCLETSGWMVLVSNVLENPQEAINIYRTKDFVEKGFDRLKNALSLKRLRVHTDERTRNKVFCGFIALILASAIDKVMRDKDLYKKYTMTELLRKISNVKSATFNGVKVMQPLSKEQTQILSAFGIKCPVG